jgi:hypothetical protein
MFDTMRGPRPDITPAQAMATALAAVPIGAHLLRSFGVGRNGDAEAVRESMMWSAAVAGALIGSDALLRAARNYAGARTEALAMSPVGAMPLDPDELALEDVEASAVLDDDLPSDEEEQAAPPPVAVS